VGDVDETRTQPSRPAGRKTLEECDVPGCAGLTVDLDDLWRQVDRVARRS
jgi:hypothetical protein